MNTIKNILNWTDKRNIHNSMTTDQAFPAVKC